MRNRRIISVNRREFAHKDKGGSCSGNLDLCPGAGIRQLPERVYLSPAEGLIRSAAAIELPALRVQDSRLRQHPGAELADPARPLP
jgi:hypothetical protein